MNDDGLTTQQAAEILNVSRPHVIRLLNEGKLAYRQVGRHRRIRPDDLSEYKKQMKTDMRAAADELAALGQELGLGDDLPAEVDAAQSRSTPPEQQLSLRPESDELLALWRELGQPRRVAGAHGEPHSRRDGRREEPPR